MHLSTYYVVGTVLSSGDKKKKQTQHLLQGTYSLVRETASATQSRWKEALEGKVLLVA